MLNGQRKLALITGASAGIGEAFAHAYAALGHDVALVARRVERLEALAGVLTAAHGVEALVIPADLSVVEAHVPVMAALEAAGRHADVLVNNAGYSIAQTFTAVPWERQRDFLMTLVVAGCGLAHAVLPGMVERGGGDIINVASLAGFAPGAEGHSLYPAAKSFAIKFTQSLDVEYRGKGVRVTALCPGFTLSEFAASNGTQAMMDATPRRFFQTAQQVVEAALKGLDAGKVIVVPGLHNQIAALALRALPGAFVRYAIARGGAKYRLEQDG